MIVWPALDFCLELIWWLFCFPSLFGKWFQRQFIRNVASWNKQSKKKNTRDFPPTCEVIPLKHPTPTHTWWNSAGRARDMGAICGSNYVDIVMRYVCGGRPNMAPKNRWKGIVRLVWALLSGPVMVLWRNLENLCSSVCVWFEWWLFGSWYACLLRRLSTQSVCACVFGKDVTRSF